MNNFRTIIAIAVVLVSAFVMQTARADDWGNLSGRFVFDGKAPTPVNLNITKDTEYCGKAPAPIDESLVVSDKGGLANVVVWLRTKNVKVSPEYAKTANDKAVIDNSHCRFDPHIVGVRVGQPLEIKNSDPEPIAHNTKADLQANQPFNSQIPASSSQNMRPLEFPETVPAAVACNIHTWMKGWLVVRPDPYFAISDKDGKFEIKNLPAGAELEFQVWQEKSGYVEKASIDGKDPKWTKGHFKYTIKPGDNDLGEIKLDPKQFNK